MRMAMPELHNYTYFTVVFRFTDPIFTHFQPIAPVVMIKSAYNSSNFAADLGPFLLDFLLLETFDCREYYHDFVMLLRPLIEIHMRIV